ncbi:hypothetical protein PQY88_00855, partial [Gammaproteobacteria bacterium]|nr:hypothetical protein [Gammaproteobacteria bacterium]
WLTILLLLSPLAFAEEIKFTLNCKVTDQVIINSKDGVAKRYASYTDRGLRLLSIFRSRT